jgi:23S rRNA pseudouridine1911/1915/1917 synthase
MQKFQVPEDLHGERIDLALHQMMDAYSRTFVQKLIRKKLVSVNGHLAKKGVRVSTGDEVSVEEAELEDSSFSPKEIPLDIIYEDDDFLVINKPSGLLTHPSAHDKSNTLVNALLHHCGDRLSGIGGERRPGIVHRLDKLTSGIMMVAKHDESHHDLAQQIQERKVEKRYRTLVLGRMKSPSGSIEAPLLKTQVNKRHKMIVSPGRDSKDSLTHFSVIEELQERYSFLDVQIITGRMHQIRVHFASIGHPVVGDELYGNKKANAEFAKKGLKRQFLHAHYLKFRHPRTHEWVEFSAPLAKDLEQVLEDLRSED